MLGGIVNKVTLEKLDVISDLLNYMELFTLMSQASACNTEQV